MELSDHEVGQFFIDIHRIAEALERIAEQRDAEDDVAPSRDKDLCMRCGLAEWDCECFSDDGEHLFASATPHGDDPLATLVMNARGDVVNLLNGEKMILGGPMPSPPVTPGAPPPERPEGLHFDPTPEPDWKPGDTVTVVTADGSRQEFTLTEDSNDPSGLGVKPEPLSPYWEWVASFEPGKPHPHIAGTGDEGFCNICGLRTSMLHTVYNAAQSLHLVRRPSEELPNSG